MNDGHADSDGTIDDGLARIAPWLRMLRVTRRLVAASDQAVRAIGLSGAQFELLAAVALAEGTSQRDLAVTLGVTKGNVAQLAARLEEERLVRRMPDGRLNRVYLTPRARQLLALALPEHEAALAERLSALPEPVRRNAGGQLDRWLVALDAALDTAPATATDDAP